MKFWCVSCGILWLGWWIECWCDGVCEVFVGLLVSEVCEMVRVSGVMHRLGMVGLWGL